MSKFIRTSVAKGDIENAFVMWRAFLATCGTGTSEDKQEEAACNAAEARVNAWVEQALDDIEQACDKAKEALIALRELYQANGADEVLDARAKAAKVLGVEA